MAFFKVFAQLLPCILFSYRLIWLDKVTWFKSWFHNLRKWESTLTFPLSQTLRQFEIYEQIFQVSLVAEECLEKGKKQKGLFFTWCFTQPTIFRHSRLFFRLGQLRSYKHTRHRTEGPLEIGLRPGVTSGCLMWKVWHFHRYKQKSEIGLNNKDYFVCLAKTELSLCKLAHLFICPED